MRTRVGVTVRPRRNRDRRHADIVDRAHAVVKSLQTYLVATDEVQPGERLEARETDLVGTWLEP